MVDGEAANFGIASGSRHVVLCTLLYLLLLLFYFHFDHNVLSLISSIWSTATILLRKVWQAVLFKLLVLTVYTHQFCS